MHFVCEKDMNWGARGILRTEWRPFARRSPGLLTPRGYFSRRDEARPVEPKKLTALMHEE